MGFLDNKTRIMDLLITDVGRQQLAAGRLRVEFASFTDMHTFYESDPVSGSVDATNRTFFEASSRYQDLITFETDDSGNLFPITNQDISLKGSTISRLTSNSTSYGKAIPALTGSDFSSVAQQLINLSSQNFKDQRLIGTRDPLFEDVNFSLSTNSIDFVFDNTVFANGARTEVSINTVESLMFDKRLSHIPNFKFLSPVVMDEGDSELVSLGSYVNLKQADDLSYEDLIKTVDVRPVREIMFSKTSSDNNISMQIFEVNAGSFRKLDVVDFGSFVTSDTARPGKHVFFAGKVIMDELKTPTFVNVLTIILD
jgi:hypothetical protein